MTARGSSLRICWDHARGCCEAGPPPSMPRCRVSIHENLERILWLRKRRRRKRPRRKRPRSRRRSEFWPGWSAQLRPGSQLRVQFGEWRAFGSAFLILDLQSLRTQGPITTVRYSKRRLPQRPKEKPRPMGPCARAQLRTRQGRRVERTVPNIHAAHSEAVSAPRTPAWRRVRQIPPQNSGAARPSPSGG